MLCDDLVTGGAPAGGCDTADRVRHGSPSGEGWRTAPAQEDESGPVRGPRATCRDSPHPAGERSWASERC
jgi:hypothetical protein